MKMHYKTAYQPDTTTANGITYSAALYAQVFTSRGFRYKTVVDALDKLYPEYVKGMGVTTGYAISSGGGSRSVTKNAPSAKDLMARFDALLAEKEMLERGGSARRAVAAVPRDW